jgi:hypothetical protein
MASSSVNVRPKTSTVQIEPKLLLHCTHGEGRHVPSVLCDAIDVVTEFMVRAWNHLDTIVLHDQGQHVPSVFGRNLGDK